MNIDLQRTFNEYSKIFISGEYDVNTISSLLDDIKYGIPELTSEEFNLLMQVPLSVLRSDLWISDINKLNQWQGKIGDYFAGNMYCIKKEDFAIDLIKKFKDRDFDLKDIVGLAEFVMENYDSLSQKYPDHLKYVLSNVEVTINHEDVSLLKEKNFYSSGNIFAAYLNKAINI